MILIDINMPKINGTIPIIALTAVELDEMRNYILNSGISDTIHKPYDVSEFLNILLKNLLSESVYLLK